MVGPESAAVRCPESFHLLTSVPTLPCSFRPTPAGVQSASPSFSRGRLQQQGSASISSLREAAASFVMSRSEGL